MAPQSDTLTLTKKAKACLANASSIPGMPMLNMGLASFGMKSSFDELQNAIDYLTCKAKAKMPFTSDEKDFLKDIFESLWAGGHLKGFREAARLADHYVNGGGKKLDIGADVYRSSAIVTDSIVAMKKYIKDTITTKRQYALLRSTDQGFLHSVHCRNLLRTGGRSLDTQGIILKTGYLLTEQKNARLKNANNRFVLAAQNTMQNAPQLLTQWSVTDVYEFEPFERANFVTDIPLGSQVLKLPDGLSQYMTVLGIAKTFEYAASWNEVWSA